MHFGLSIPALTVCAFVTVAGIIGNSLTLAIFLKFVKFRNTIGAFIFSLTLANLAISAFTIPTNYQYFFEPSQFWLTYVELCYVLKIVCYGSTLASWILIGLITINRAIKICCHRDLYVRIFNKISTTVMIASSWIYGYTFVILVVSGIGGRIHADELNCALELKEMFLVYIFTLVTVIMILLLCYLAIYIYVQRSRNATRNTRPTNSFKLEKKILSTTLAFIICYAPPVVHEVFRDKEEVIDSTDVVTFVCYLPIYLAAIVNPIIYCMQGSLYRDAYRQLFPCCAKKQDLAHNEESSRTLTSNAQTSGSHV